MPGLPPGSFPSRNRVPLRCWTRWRASAAPFQALINACVKAGDIMRAERQGRLATVCAVNHGWFPQPTCVGNG